MPTYMSIGTTTGAISAHWAEPEVISRLSAATISTSAANNTSGGRSALVSSSEPLIAVHWPRFDQEK